MKFDISSKNEFANRIWQGHPGERAYSMVQSKENRVKPSQGFQTSGGQVQKTTRSISIFRFSQRNCWE